MQELQELIEIFNNGGTLSRDEIAQLFDYIAKLEKHKADVVAKSVEWGGESCFKHTKINQQATFEEFTSGFPRFCKWCADEALKSILGQCQGHSDEFSGNVWRLASDVLNSNEKFNPFKPVSETGFKKYVGRNVKLSIAGHEIVPMSPVRASFNVVSADPQASVCIRFGKMDGTFVEMHVCDHCGDQFAKKFKEFKIGDL